MASITLTEYVPAVEIAMVSDVEVKLPGPVQLYLNGPVPPVTPAVIIAGAVWHPAGPVMATTGFGFTIKVAEQLVKHPFASVMAAV